jgi:hypothetical protein
MYRHCGVVVLVLIVASTVPAAVAAPHSLHAWFVDSLIKVFPGDPAGTHRLPAAEFDTARNQHLSFQLAVRSQKALGDVYVEVEPLRGKQGEIISGASARAVGYVVVGSSTKDTPAEELVGQAPGWYPDPLWNKPVQVVRNRTCSFWITIAIPEDATPDLYRGVLTLRAGTRTLKRVEFRVLVLAARIPPQSTLKITNWFNLSDATSRQFYGIAQFSDEWWSLVANIGKVMADHRQNVVITPLLDLVQARAEGDRLAYDFSNFDRWVETFRKAGVVGYIEGSHLLDRAGSYDAALTVHTYQVEDGKVVRRTLPPDEPRAGAFLTGFLSALSSHLDQKGWKSIYLQHILDEPHGPEPPYYARFAELMHRNMPGIPTLDAMDAAHMDPELQNNCDVWVPQLGRFDDQLDMIRSRIREGHEVWFYTCLFPNKRYLNRLIDYPLLKVRLLHWLNFRYDFAGYLHWGWNYWTPEPVNDTQPVIDANTQLLPPGDAFIVYPDRANKSVFSSIRLEAMREGIEDYELLRALKQKNPEEAVRLSQAAVGTLTEYVRDPAEFRRIERRLLEALSK